VGKRLMQAMPGRVVVPTSVFRTKKLLVMTFVDGDNLSKLKEFRNKLMPGWMKKRAGYSIIIYFYFEFYCTQYLFFQCTEVFFNILSSLDQVRGFWMFCLRRGRSSFSICECSMRILTQGIFVWIERKEL
jgi:hypothetical protein